MGALRDACFPERLVRLDKRHWALVQQLLRAFAWSFDHGHGHSGTVLGLGHEERTGLHIPRRGGRHRRHRVAFLGGALVGLVWQYGAVFDESHTGRRSTLRVGAVAGIRHDFFCRDGWDEEEKDMMGEKKGERNFELRAKNKNMFVCFSAIVKGGADIQMSMVRLKEKLGLW